MIHVQYLSRQGIHTKSCISFQRTVKYMKQNMLTLNRDKYEIIVFSVRDRALFAYFKFSGSIVKATVI